jgi:hypothetical protein
MVKVLKANRNYLKKLQCFFLGKEVQLLDYKLVRKELYVSNANLSAAFNRMLSEPKNKQQNKTSVNEFVILNNVLSSNIAGLFAINTGKEQHAITKELLQSLNRSVAILEETVHLMDPSFEAVTEINYSNTVPGVGKLSDQHIKEHVDFIHKLAVDIQKAVQKIVRK